MKKIEGFEKLDENGNFKPLPPGMYVVEITDVVDHPDKECLEIYHDVAEGEHKDHFKNLMAQTGGTNKSRSYRSYKPKAMTFFKGFIVSIEKSNPGFTWDWDEKKLIGKKAVAVYGEEEFVGTNEDGTKECRTMCRVQEWHSLQALKEGKLVVPAKKLLTDQQKLEIEESKKLASSAPSEIDDSDVPF